MRVVDEGAPSTNRTRSRRSISIVATTRTGVAHFVNLLVFCMFADDVGLLPDHMFTRMLERARRAPDRFTDLAATLFRGMAQGGLVAIEPVDWVKRRAVRRRRDPAAGEGRR